MFKSMTGYGKGEAVSRPYGRFTVEVHGVNRKYCDIIINLPRQLLVLESRIREIIQSGVTRGRINVFVSQPKEIFGHKLFINTDLAKQYFRSIKKLKKELKLKGELDLSLITSLKEIVTYLEPETDPRRVWPVLERALKKALGEFNQMRIKEGMTIARQIEKPLFDIEEHLQEIGGLVPQLAERFKERLESRLEETRISVSHTDERIQKEVAILAEHMDITEELNRMKSHIAQFRSLVNKRQAVGRTLDFLLQEMIREVNTMGAKAVHTEISTQVVYIKSELEKIREQIQNVE